MTALVCLAKFLFQCRVAGRTALCHLMETFLCMSLFTNESEQVPPFAVLHRVSSEPDFLPGNRLCHAKATAVCGSCCQEKCREKTDLSISPLPFPFANSANLLFAVPRKCHLPPIQKATVSNINKQFYNCVVGIHGWKTAVRRHEYTVYILTSLFS